MKNLSKAQAFLHFFSTSIRDFDQFGQGVTLYFNKKEKVGSRFGGIISFLVLIIGIKMIWDTYMVWTHQDDLSIVTSSIQYGALEIIAMNRTFLSDFTPQNYYPYFNVKAVFPDGTVRSHMDLRDYFTIKMTYTDRYLIAHNLEYEPCYYTYRYAFLELDSDILTTGDSSQKTSNFSVCVKNQSYTMGYIGDSLSEDINATNLEFSLRLCQNTTESQNCKSTHEIRKMLKYVKVKPYIPRTNYLFDDVDKPTKNFYDVKEYGVDMVSTKKIISYLALNYLYTDNGFITADYSLDNLNFNVDKESFDLTSRDDDEPLFSFNLRFGLAENYYYRNNIKIMDMIGNYGGFMSVVINIASFLCLFYNSLYLNHKIINASFSVPDPEDNDKTTKLKFSIYQYVKSMFYDSENNIYNKANEFIFEYLDLKKIIIKLEEIEILKRILLDDIQRKLVEGVPKPMISLKSHPERVRLSTRFKLERTSTRRIEDRGNLDEYYDMLEDKESVVNQRLFALYEESKFRNMRNSSSIMTVKDDGKYIISSRFIYMKIYRKKPKRFS